MAEPGQADASLDRAVRWATLAAAALVAHQVAGKATRDALFLSSFDLRYLPPMMMLGAALSTVAVFWMSRLLASQAPSRMLPLAIGTGAVLLMVQWVVSLAAPEVAALIVYVYMALFGATLVSGFWSAVNERFDPYTARRAVGRIGTGAALGGVVGGGLAWGVSRAIPVPAMLLVMAGVAITALWSAVVMGPPLPGARAAPDPELGPLGFRGTLATIRSSGFLRSLAVIVGLGALTEALLEYAMSAAAKSAFSSRPEALMSFFSLYHAAVGLVGLLLQGVLARLALERIGLAGSVATKPASVAAAGALAFLSPGLLTAALARGLPSAMNNSLFRSGYELLYTPLPEAVKRPVKAIVDVGIDKAGAFVGSGIVFALVWAAPGSAQRTLLGLSALLGLAVVGVCRGVHRGYVAALAESLRSGAVSLDASDILDSTTRLTLARTGLTLNRETLLEQVRATRSERDAGQAHREVDEDPLLESIRALRSGSPREARRVLTGPALAEQLAPHIVPLLGQNELFLDALRALRRLAPRITGLLTDALLDATQPPTVRRRLPRVLRTNPSQRSVDALLLGLSDARFDVRFECAAALSRLKSGAPQLRTPEWDVYDQVLRELTEGTADHPVQRRTELVFNLLALVLEREPLRIAYRAIRSETDPTMRGTALEYLENVLPERVRQALWPLLGLPTRSPADASRRRDLVAELLRRSRSSGQPEESGDDDPDA